MNVLLFVEDDVDIRDAIADLLQFNGWSIVPAGDGLEALAWLASNERPVAILLDLKMPRCDGYEFRRRQLSDPALADIPTIVLTADGRVDSPDGAPILKGLTILRKPIDFDELMAFLSGLVR